MERKNGIQIAELSGFAERARNKICPVERPFFQRKNKFYFAKLDSRKKI
jgi:hypothetical protein